MMLHTIFCNHYQAMSEHKVCKAGVIYAELPAHGKPISEWPCFCRNGQPPPGGCDKAVFPTAEEIAAKEAEIAKRFERTMKCRQAIVAHLGSPWRRGMKGSAGQIDCPACGNKQCLRFTRSGYNGHIHATCISEGCVSWME